MEVGKVALVMVLKVLLVQSFAVNQPGKGFREHRDYVKAFPCANPQPRSLRYNDEDVWGKNERPPFDAQVYPHMTVLHRCDSQSGCCGVHSECSPKTVELVNLAFRVIKTELNSSGQAIPRENFTTITVVNHTSCECQGKYDRPK